MARWTIGSAHPLLLLGVWVLLSAGWPLLAGAEARSSVRSTDPLISTLMIQGRARSSTFRKLVETIDGTNGIVYVETGQCPVPRMRGCLLHRFDDEGHARYLWIVVNTEHWIAAKAGRGPAVLIALIAHELQHATEVLQNPSIHTSSDILNFYRSVVARDMYGVDVLRGGFSYETRAALETEEAVRAELAVPVLPPRRTAP